MAREEFVMKEGMVSIFPNKWKKTSTHPDYLGKGMFNGVEIEISLWQKRTKSHVDFFGGQIISKEERERKYSKKEYKKSTENTPAKEDNPPF